MLIKTSGEVRLIKKFFPLILPILKRGITPSLEEFKEYTNFSS